MHKVRPLACQNLNERIRGSSGSPRSRNEEREREKLDFCDFWTRGVAKSRFFESDSLKVRPLDLLSLSGGTMEVHRDFRVFRNTQSFCDVCDFVKTENQQLRALDKAANMIKGT